MYKTNWEVGHNIKQMLETHKGPLTGQGHKGLYEILTTSWHAQLSLDLAMLGERSFFSKKRYQKKHRVKLLLSNVQFETGVQKKAGDHK